MQNPQDDILLQLFQQQPSPVQHQESETPESFTELTPKDNARVEGFLDALFKNANTLAITSSTFTVGSIMTASFAVARIIAIPAYVCTIGYSVAVMTAAITALEQFSIAISEKGFSLEFNPDFWKSVSRVSTIASVGYFALYPHWQAEERADAGTERYYSTQLEFTNPVQQKPPNYMGYGIAIAITAILVFLLKRRK
ncbi:MAG: hypothetical protein HC836_37590 [Richelia sp. RM2_1_2]|nr:hypothetical protein [Richelia sp. SM2_1_7]NJM22408.1 hypothetical protein [Richelia sp. SM1_7_0]NJN12417.1 hypothetical protein [Richelia sp. RM1_1_1]NJO30150.1 hypothetical protein [Richelia sp. SL_2_1]NJO63700.1 hypothetical protein [Richelia sp. RM2_1_2]